MTSISHAKIPVTSAEAASLTEMENAQANDSAFVSVEGGEIRWLSSPDAEEQLDGDTGHKVGDGDTFTVTGRDDLTNFRALALGDPATLQVTYQRG